MTTYLSTYLSTNPSNEGPPSQTLASDAAEPMRTVVNVRMAVLLIAVLLTGLSAGFFYAYEISVTLGLAQVDDATYVATFQALNATIRNAGFAIAFFGAVPAIVGALALHWGVASAKRWLIALSLALYLACVVVTFAGNVPLNNELAELESVTPDSAAAARADFEAVWNQLNLIRTFAVVASFATLVAAAGLPGRHQKRPAEQVGITVG